MRTSGKSEGVTALLDRWRSGDRSVENELAERIYPILRAQAQAQVTRAGGAVTLCATELANEAYERLAEQKSVEWRNRDHFFAIAAMVLRRVVVDYARQRASEKRGGLAIVLPLDDVDTGDMPQQRDPIDWLEMEQALDELGRIDAGLVRVVELRVFAGLPVERIAELCDSSPRTIGRRWRVARAWLADRLRLGDAG